MVYRITLAASASLVALAASTAAHAGGFQLNERSSKALGASLSGATSAASDASFAAFNPAALSIVDTAEVSNNVSLVAPIAEGTVALTGDKVDADQPGIVPGMAAGYRVNEEIVAGLTVYSPFGLVTDYESEFIGRFDAETSRLTTISVSPTVAWEPMDGLSLGASVNALYSDARLTSGVVSLEGDSIDVGFSLGALYEPIEGTQLGVAYHHGYDLRLEGSNTVNVLPGTPSFDTEAEASLPAVFMAGITQDISPDFRVMAEGRWIGWDAFDTIDISTPGAPDLSPLGPDFTMLEEEQNYEDSFFVAVGAEYDIDERYTVRGGVAYDDTPTTDADRTPRVPDEDRLWLSLGGSVNLTEQVTVDASYSYLHALEDATVTLNSVPTSVEYDGGAHIFSVGGTIRF